MEVVLVVDTFLEGYVYTKVLSFVFADAVDAACLGEETGLMLVETDCHNSVGRVEGLFDSIPVVYIDV